MAERRPASVSPIGPSSPPPLSDRPPEPSDWVAAINRDKDKDEGSTQWMHGSLVLDDLTKGANQKYDPILEEANRPLQGLSINEAASEIPPFTKINQVHPYTENVNLIVKVVNLKTLRLPTVRNQVSAEYFVGDETGMAIFKACGEKQVSLMVVGSTITLRKAKVELFKKNMRLRLLDDESIEAAEPAQFSVMTENNLSLVPMTKKRS